MIEDWEVENPPLATLENRFQNYLLDSSPKNTGSVPVTDPARLSIYYHAYYSRRTENLENAFSEFRKWIGSDLFHLLALEYLHETPSQDWSIRWTGRHFYEFCNKKSDLPPGSTEWIALEWMLTLAFDAPDHDAAQTEHLATVPPEKWGDLSFTLHPSVSHLPLTYNLIPVYQKMDSLPLQKHPCSERLTPLEQKCCALIWRDPKLKVHFRSMDEDEWVLIEALQEKKTFSDMCEILYERHPDHAEQIPLQAAGYLKTWLENGLLAEIHIFQPLE